MNSKVYFLLAVALANLGRLTADFRLPRFAIPEHYKIKILTDLSSDFSYKGEVCIDFQVTERTDRIVLHSKNLKIFENMTELVELKDSFPQNAENVISRLRRNFVNPKQKSYVFNESLRDELRPDEPIFSSTEVVLLESFEKDKNTENKASFSENENESSTLQQFALKVENGSSELSSLSHEVSSSSSEHPPSSSELPSSSSEHSPSSSELPSSSSSELPPSSSEIPSFSFELPSSSSELPSSSSEVTISEESPVTSNSVTAEAPVTFTSSFTNHNTISTTEKPLVIENITQETNVVINQSNDAIPESATLENYAAEKHEYYLKNNFLTINFNRALEPGKKFRLRLKYEGVLSDSLLGYYRVPYTKRGSQKTTWLASTVFEPNEARTAFPCFDEPDLKATFDVILGHEKSYTALSNMPLKSTSPVVGKSDWQWSTFETTPRMSTYLVAFLISDLEYLTPRLNNTNSDRKVAYRFWSRHDVLYKTRYAMRIAPEMKKYLENLLQVRDVLPKHDFVALPSFVSTALENWGLYSFAENNILFTPGFSSLFTKLQITQVLGHEIAHMWFGNMVTPKWWDQVWLNEGFSNFFEIIAADHVQPTWDLKTTAVIFAYLKVFSLDALHSTHPLVPDFDEPNDLNEIFDSISYQKGFYIVRMLNYTLGQEPFLNGVRKYLKANLLSNVDENDLWEVLNEFAHQEANLPPEFHLKEIMANWTRKAGYPIVEVERDYENNTAVVTQKRFLRFKGDYEFRDNSYNYADEDTKWWIPLTYTTGSEMNFRETSPKIWLNPGENYKTLTDMPSKNDFVLMNLDAAGLYRVNYDDRNWALLISFLINENFSEISVLNRVQILDDLLDLARSGDISYEKALDATGYLTREKHFLPWKTALSNFDFISRMFRSKDGSRTLKKFLRHLVSARFEELGFEYSKDETFSDSLNRKQIVKWACKSGLRQCTRKSNSLFKRWMEEKKPDEKNPVPSSLRSVVYCSAIENGGNREWQFLWQRYLYNTLTDKTAILYGLGCSRNTRTLKRYLDWSIKESSGIRKQDTPVVFKAVARNDVGFNLAKNFMKEKMSELQRYVGNNPFFLPSMIDTLAAKMNQPSDLKDLEDMEEENYRNYHSTPRCFKQAFERVKFNIDWTNKHYQTITDWLKKQKF